MVHVCIVAVCSVFCSDNGAIVPVHSLPQRCTGTGVMVPEKVQAMLYEYWWRGIGIGTDNVVQVEAQYRQCCTGTGGAVPA